MPKTNQTRVALIQMRCGLEPDKNFAHAIEFVRDAAKHRAKIVCLPELFKSQYFCQTEDHANFALAEEVPGKSTATLGEVARELGVIIIASLFERRSAGVYHNTAAIIAADGNLLGKYRKMHIPDDPLYHEKFYFAPGDLGFQAWKTQAGNLGVCVCWDQWYPEAARLTALRGAEIIFYPTAIGWHPKEKNEFGEAQHSSWELIQRSHAIANGCYVAAANRVGHEKPAGGEGIEFWGQSFICGPDGQIIAKGSVDQEEIVMAEIDWDRVNEHRTHWPFLRDRRVDAYAGIEQRLLD
ncbi:MAG: Nitrilase/cyanide hydratase and apolipoprotein N-acyltransferase [Spartobacteria bacterium]|nr:Nitrilase/cyanide hydratase and apolipoprotein N-acyltransferase [Spartobacteria bacterium]